jgi:hypothetical protein
MHHGQEKCRVSTPHDLVVDRALRRRETRPMSSSAGGFFERYFALINEHDLRHVDELFTDDLEFDDDAWPGVIHGREEMRRFLTCL